MIKPLDFIADKVWRASPDFESQMSRGQRIKAGIGAAAVSASSFVPFLMRDPSAESIRPQTNVQIAYNNIGECAAAHADQNLVIDGTNVTVLGRGPTTCQTTNIPDWSVNGMQVFGPDGPKVTDPIQADEGDCWVIGTLASFANQAPDAIKSAIAKQDPDGSFWVRVYLPHNRETFGDKGTSSLRNSTIFTEAGQRLGLWDHPGTPVLVHVTPADVAQAAEHSKSTVAWPIVLEAGIAKAWGGYDVVTHGNDPAAIEFALTGGTLNTRTVTHDPLTFTQVKIFPTLAMPWTVAKTLAMIDSANKEGDLVDLQTYFKTWTQTMKNVEENHNYTEIQLLHIGGQPLKPGEPYDFQDGHYYVVERNPWGDTVPKMSPIVTAVLNHLYPGEVGDAGGIYALSGKQVVKLFALMYQASVPDSNFSAPAATTPAFRAS